MRRHRGRATPHQPETSKREKMKRGLKGATPDYRRKGLWPLRMLRADAFAELAAIGDVPGEHHSSKRPLSLRLRSYRLVEGKAGSQDSRRVVQTS